MKVLIATQKPFAAVAVEGIKKILVEAGHEVVLLEKYAEQAEFVKAVADAEALIIRSDKVTAEVIAAAPKLKIVVRTGFAASWMSDGEEVQDPEDPENAVSDHHDFSLEVYPNPAHEQVSVLVPASFRNGQLRISDLNGRVVRTLPVNPSSELNVLSVSDLSCGVYVISVMNDNDIAFKKLIISR